MSYHSLFTSSLQPISRSSIFVFFFHPFRGLACGHLPAGLPIKIQYAFLVSCIFCICKAHKPGPNKWIRKFVSFSEVEMNGRHETDSRRLKTFTGIVSVFSYVRLQQAEYCFIKTWCFLLPGLCITWNSKALLNQSNSSSVSSHFRAWNSLFPLFKHYALLVCVSFQTAWTTRCFLETRSIYIDPATH
jgi:hypothetical protein